MFTIGDFARHGSVSVRMLRHYDAEGLLRPAYVDRVTGYRFYEADQLSRLNRIVALKELGFGLAQVRAVLDEPIDAGELRGMLRLRRAQLGEQIAADRARLLQVEARLRIIESEGQMSTPDVVLKSVPAVRLAQLGAIADSYEHDDIGPVVQRLYAELGELLGRTGVAVTGPAVAYYQPTDDGKVRIHAGLAVSIDAGANAGFEVVDLPAVETAATLVHSGPMKTIGGSFQDLGRWIEDNGYRVDGPAREFYLVTMPEPQENWVTELQEPVVAVEVPAGR